MNSRMFILFMMRHEMIKSKDNELSKISKTREMAIFIKLANQKVDKQTAINSSMVEFAKDALEILDCYESIIVREKSNKILNNEEKKKA
jgi:hypothetical protein